MAEVGVLRVFFLPVDDAWKAAIRYGKGASVQPAVIVCSTDSLTEGALVEQVEEQLGYPKNGTYDYELNLSAEVQSEDATRLVNLYTDILDRREEVGLWDTDFELDSWLDHAARHTDSFPPALRAVGKIWLKLGSAGGLSLLRQTLTGKGRCFKVLI